MCAINNSLAPLEKVKRTVDDKLNIFLFWKICFTLRRTYIHHIHIYRRWWLWIFCLHVLGCFFLCHERLRLMNNNAQWITKYIFLNNYDMNELNNWWRNETERAREWTRYNNNIIHGFVWYAVAIYSASGIIHHMARAF